MCTQCGGWSSSQSCLHLHRTTTVRQKMKATRIGNMFCLSFIALIGSVPRSVQSQSNYCSFSSEHTLCKYEEVGPACGQPLSRVVGSEGRQIIVDRHNRLRSRVAMGSTSQPPASNMMELQWDEELAMVAQRLADQCKFGHDCSECRRVARFRVGQNLYQSFTTRQGSSSDWVQAVDAWFSEIELFPVSSVSQYAFSPTTGHYSQMVWATTSKVGCGETEYRNGRFIARLFVCNYGEGGNLISAPVYKIGESCSSCPPSSSCSSSSPGLCSAGSAQTGPSQTAVSEQTRSPPRLQTKPLQQFVPSPAELTTQPTQQRPTSPPTQQRPTSPPTQQRPTSPLPTATTTIPCTSFLCLFSQPSIMVEGLMDSAHSMGDAAMNTVQNLSDFVFRFNSGFFG